MATKTRGLVVVVGERWSDAVAVQVEDFSSVSESSVKAKVVQKLALGAGLLIAVFAGYGMIGGDGALLDRIYTLAEWTILFVLGWIAGHVRGGP